MKQQAFSLKDSAIIFDVHPDTLRRAIKSGKLKAAKIGKDYRISKFELERFFQAMGGTSLFGDNDTQPHQKLMVFYKSLVLSYLKIRNLILKYQKLSSTPLPHLVTFTQKNFPEKYEKNGTFYLLLSLKKRCYYLSSLSMSYVYSSSFFSSLLDQSKKQKI